MSHVTFNPGDNWPINHVFLSSLLFVNELWEKYIMRIYIKPWWNILEMRNSQYQKWIKKIFTYWLCETLVPAHGIFGALCWTFCWGAWTLCCDCRALVQLLRGMWNLSSPSRGQAPVPCMTRCIPNQRTTREVPRSDLNSWWMSWTRWNLLYLPTLLIYEQNVEVRVFVMIDLRKLQLKHCDDTMLIIVFLFVYLRNQIITYFSFITRTLKNRKLLSP